MDDGRAPQRREGLEPGGDPWACELIAAVVRRDRAAFGELFRFFAPRIKAFTMRGGADPDAAQEVAQETMIAVWRRAATFDRRKAAASTWVFTIARNKRIDMFRRDGRPPQDADELALFADDHEPAAEDAAITAQSHDRLREALPRLPPEQAAVLQKAYFEDKTHLEIAAELGLPMGTVKSRIRLALARLRSALHGDHA
ncbi:MAG: sigma-70 family RNA polymerase sigma factor [Rhodospirillales bacterium]|nr:MAG: sigma-70 family RNA polymerase sigma factor [Rhodospirillales bacterium]